MTVHRSGVHPACPACWFACRDWPVPFDRPFRAARPQRHRWRWQPASPLQNIGVADASSFGHARGVGRSDAPPDPADAAALLKENAKLKARLSGSAIRERELQSLVKSTQASLAKERGKHGAGAAADRTGSFGSAYFMEGQRGSAAAAAEPPPPPPPAAAAAAVAAVDPMIPRLEARINTLQAALATAESELATAKAAMAGAVSPEKLAAAEVARAMSVDDLGKLMVEHSALASLSRDTADMVERLQKQIAEYEAAATAAVAVAAAADQEPYPTIESSMGPVS